MGVFFYRSLQKEGLTMKMTQTLVVCPMMIGKSESNTRFCDEFGWKVRKNYPAYLKTCSPTNCIGRQNADNPLPNFCDVRESCKLGHDCYGDDLQCTLRQIIKEKQGKIEMTGDCDQARILALEGLQC